MIIIEDVCFKYQHNLILDEINFEVKKGDFIGIIGRNGSGKTTLLKLILGINRPMCGRIIVDKDIKIGYIQQLTINSEISFPTSVFETVMLGLYEEIGRFRFPKSEHRQKVEKALKTVGLEDYANKQISRLSGGEQQRVMIAKSLVSNPDLLILDEPTTGIDADSENSFISLLKKLNIEENKTIIIVTHDIHLIETANKLYEIKDKTIKEVGIYA